MTGRAATLERRLWRDVLERARLAVTLGRRGIPLTTLSQAQLRTAERKAAAAAPCPIADRGAWGEARTAFAAGVEALLRSASAAHRAARAEDLAQACNVLERLLDDQARADAEVWRRRFPQEDA